MKWSVEQQPFKSNIESKLNPAGQDHQSSAVEDVRFVVMQISVGCCKFLLELYCTTYGCLVFLQVTKHFLFLDKIFLVNHSTPHLINVVLSK